MERTIKLRDAVDAAVFASAASRCMFDIKISAGATVINAKSILDVMEMDFAHPLTVSYHGVNEAFEKTLKEFKS